MGPRSRRTDVPPSSIEAETKEWFYNYICAEKNSKCFYSLESFEKSTFEQNWRKPREGPDSSINKKPLLCPRRGTIANRKFSSLYGRVLIGSVDPVACYEFLVTVPQERYDLLSLSLRHAIAFPIQCKILFSVFIAAEEREMRRHSYIHEKIPVLRRNRKLTVFTKNQKRTLCQRERNLW